MTTPSRVLSVLAHKSSSLTQDVTKDSTRFRPGAAWNGQDFSNTGKSVWLTKEVKR